MIALAVSEASAASKGRPTLEILAIEDNPGDVRLIREALETDPGCHVTAVGDGSEGLAVLDGGVRPDLVLLDINLPGAGGLEIVARIKSIPALRDTPVVMFTSSALPEDVRKATDRGADAYVVKPFDVGEYLAVLRDVRRRFLEEAS